MIHPGAASSWMMQSVEDSISVDRDGYGVVRVHNDRNVGCGTPVRRREINILFQIEPHCVRWPQQCHRARSRCDLQHGAATAAPTGEINTDTPPPLSLSP